MLQYAFHATLNYLFLYVLVSIGADIVKSEKRGEKFNDGVHIDRRVDVDVYLAHPTWS